MKRRIGETIFLSTLALTLFVVKGFAEDKGFEFGPGTANPTSSTIKFAIPCHIQVATDITFRRVGETGTNSDVPIVVEYRQPGPSATTEGALVRTVNLTAKRSEQKTPTYWMPGAAAGCSIPWAVTARAATGNSSVGVFGSVRMSPYITIPSVEIEGGLISLAKGNSVTKNFGTSAGFGQHVIEVRGTWFHSVLGVPGPLPVRLKFELLKPDGSVAASDSGYTNFEINPCCSWDKLLVRYLNNQHISGQWKLRITNNSNDDVMNIAPKAGFYGACKM